MHAPGETIALGGGEDFVFLRVIKILNLEPPLLFAERRVGEVAFAVGLEGPR
jgi:hypothetical protein